MQNHNFEGHRVYQLIRFAKEVGRDSIDFFHPVSILANKKYEELCTLLNQQGYIASPVSNPQGNTLVGIMRISNITNV